MPGHSRFLLAVQPSIVRLYKVAGLVALTAILVGLIGFLVVNIFYFFDHTWVRPVVLSPNHPKVVEASLQVNAARKQLGDYKTEQLQIQVDLGKIDETLAADDAELAALDTAPEHPKTEAEIARAHVIFEKQLDKKLRNADRGPLKARLENLTPHIKDQEQLVSRLEASPYLRATNHETVLAFVPYQNLKNVKLGTKLYSCSWGLVMCSNVGQVKSTIDGEVENIHPHDESIQRGMMVEIELTTPSASGDSVLFAGGKPLWLF